MGEHTKLLAAFTVLALVVSAVLIFIPLPLLPSSSAGASALILISLVVIGWGAKAMKMDLSHKNALFKKLGKQLGLAFSPGSAFSFPSLYGRIGNHNVKIELKTLGKKGERFGATFLLVESSLLQPVPVDFEVRARKNSVYRESMGVKLALQEFDSGIKTVKTNLWADASNPSKAKSMVSKASGDLAMLFDEFEIEFFAVSAEKAFFGKRLKPGPLEASVSKKFVDNCLKALEKSEGAL